MYFYLFVLVVGPILCILGMFAIDLYRKFKLLIKQSTKIYIVTAYRWGGREGHSYVVGAFDTAELAIAQAKLEKEWRGGKYECEILVMDLNDALKYKNYEVVYKTKDW